MISWKDCNRLATVLILALVVIISRPGLAVEYLDSEPKAETKRPPLAKFITVRSPVEDVMSGRVKNVAIALQHQAVQEKRQAILVLEITPGSSEFHHIQGLAKFLIDPKLSKVITVAWIQEIVIGNNVVLAFACNEIVMHENAQLGDIGRGVPLDPVDRQFVISLVDNRHNIKVNRALAVAMMDVDRTIWKVQFNKGPSGQEISVTQILTQKELEELQKTNKEIKETRIIKESGEIGLFSGRGARDDGYLVKQTAESRTDLADSYGILHESLREDATAGEAWRAKLIKINGMIEPILEGFVLREIKRAIAERANLLIFEIDSPGGFLRSSTNLAHAIVDLESKNIRTVAYIPREAMSGAAIIALGCDEIYMKPDAQIGDAEPIEMKAGGQFERAPEKILGPLRVTLKDLAEKKGRPPGLAAAMADKDLEVFQVLHKKTGRISFMTDDEIHKSNDEWIKGRLVVESRKENLLTINGKNAHEFKLAEPTVADMEELKQRLGISPGVELVAAQRTWVDTLVYLLNTKVALFLLFLVGSVCIYLELYTMTGFFGIGSTLCFSLFFWSRFLGGTAGWLEVVLFLLGLVCIALEIFVIPGFGVFGVSGGFLVMVSLILASQTFVVPQSSAQISEMGWTMGILCGAIVSVITLAILTSRYFPQMPLLNQMILAPPQARNVSDSDGPQLRPEYSEVSSRTSLIAQDSRLVGQQGTVLSVLRPAGKARINDQFVDVVSEGPYILQGCRIEVVAVSGNRVVVREINGV